MNELVWEGLLEILREGQPSLKAAARLWRRDDFFGSDWGGQLELPVVFRRLLPAEEYLVRLPSGLEGRARIASGPSTTTMTFPTLTGIGNPPFGASAGAAESEVAPASADEIESAAEASDGVEAPASTPPRRRGERSARQGGRGSRGRGARTVAQTEAPAAPEAPPMRDAPDVALPEAEPVRASASAPVAPAPIPEAPPVPEALPVREAVREPAITLRSPTPAMPIDTPRPALRPQRARAVITRLRPDAPRRPASADPEAGVEQTEALARAFLAAVEARDRLAPLEHDGFEGRAIAAARQDVEAVAAALEGALRSMDGATTWADELRQPFALLTWFASLAAPDRDGSVADAGSAVESMLATIEGVLALGLVEAGTERTPRAA